VLPEGMVQQCKDVRRKQGNDVKCMYNVFYARVDGSKSWKCCIL